MDDNGSRDPSPQYVRVLLIHAGFLLSQQQHMCDGGVSVAVATVTKCNIRQIGLRIAHLQMRATVRERSGLPCTTAASQRAVKQCSSFCKASRHTAPPARSSARPARQQGRSLRCHAMAALYLGLDFGTSGARATVIDSKFSM